MESVTMSKRIQKVSYFQMNIQVTRKNYSLNVHVGIRLKKRLLNLKVAIRKNVRTVKHLELRVNKKQIINQIIAVKLRSGFI